MFSSYKRTTGIYLLCAYIVDREKRATEHTVKHLIPVVQAVK